MLRIEETIVGSKGEILPKKHLRNISGIKAGDKVLIEALLGELRIKKVFSIEEVFEMPIISRGKANDIEVELEQEQRNQERLTD